MPGDFEIRTNRITIHFYNFGLHNRWLWNKRFIIHWLTPSLAFSVLWPTPSEASEIEPNQTLTFVYSSFVLARTNGQLTFIFEFKIKSYKLYQLLTAESDSSGAQSSLDFTPVTAGIQQLGLPLMHNTNLKLDSYVSYVINVPQHT